MSRTRIGTAERDTIRRLIEAEIDWRRVIELATRNAVMPLTCIALREEERVPAAVRGEFQRGWLRCAAHNSHLARELCRILDRLAAVDIPARAYKGPALAMQAYGDLTLRQMGDLDILIRREDLQAAQRVLEAEGYTLELSAEEADRCLRDRYHFHFHKADPPLEVELHWAVTPAMWPFPLPEPRVWGPAATVSLNHTPVPTFDAEVTLLALCAHGAKERWSRMSLVVDVAELIAFHPALDWEWVMGWARQAERMRVVLLGLALAQWLLGAQLPEQVCLAIDADPRLTGLVRQLRACYETGEVLKGARFHRFSWNVWNCAQDRRRMAGQILKSLPRRVGALLRTSPQDREFLPLPARLEFLYCLVRPVRAVANHGPRRLTRIILNHL